MSHRHISVLVRVSRNSCPLANNLLRVITKYFYESISSSNYCDFLHLKRYAHINKSSRQLSMQIYGILCYSEKENGRTKSSQKRIS